MSAERPLAIDYSQQDPNSAFIPRPAVHSSQYAGWKNIHLAHYQLPAIDFPEATGLQHLISLPSWKQPTEVEMIVDGKQYRFQHDQQEKGYVEIDTANVPLKVRSSQAGEATHCYLDPTFLAHAAYESANPEQVELKPTLSALIR